MNLNNATEPEKLTLKDYIYFAIAFLLLPTLVWLFIHASGQHTTKMNALEQGIIKPLEEAARTNRVSVARSELQKAVSFINRTPRLRNYISGEDPNWQYWYENLLRQLQNLQAINNESTQEEKLLTLLQTNRVLLQKDEIIIPRDSEAIDNFNMAFFSGMLAVQIYLGLACVLALDEGVSMLACVPYLLFRATCLFEKSN